MNDRFKVFATCLLCMVAGMGCVLAVPLLFYEDAVHYVSLGAHLGAGQGYRSALLRFPDLMQPPLYPLLIGLLRPVAGDAVRAALLICLFAQAATVVALYLLHTAIWGRPGRLCTAAIAAIYPNLAFGAALVLEPLFLCLIAFAVYFIVSAAQRESLGRAAWAGGFLGLALLVRPEVVITGACGAAFLVLWPGSPARRGLRLMGLLLPAVLLVLPYGLWMKGRIGVFEVLPKVRYNLVFADITEHMAWEPEEEAMGGREQRTFFTLMPDHRDFVMNHAFNHEGFDARRMFPRRTEAKGHSPLRALLGSIRMVLADAIVHSGVMNPLVLLLILLMAWRGLLRPSSKKDPVDTADPQAVYKVRLLHGLLLLLVGLHLGPAVLSGADYTSRYLAASLLFSVPLVGAGVAQLARILSRRGLREGPTLWALAAVVLVCYGVATVRVASAQSGGRVARERTSIIEQACERYIPEGARVLAEHSRYTFLRHGEAFQLPYARTPEELVDYIAAHDIQYAIFDAVRLHRNPSRVDRMLLSPDRWPPSFVPLVELFVGRDPVWIVKLK